MLPAEFRAEYGAPMLQAFRDKYREVCAELGKRGLILLWVEAIVDLLSSAAREHAEIFTRDVQYGARMLVRHRGASGLAILALALGIGSAEPRAADLATSSSLRRAPSRSCCSSARD